MYRKLCSISVAYCTYVMINKYENTMYNLNAFVILLYWPKFARYFHVEMYFAHRSNVIGRSSYNNVPFIRAPSAVQIRVYLQNLPTT